VIATPPPPKTPQTLPLDPRPQLGNLPLRHPPDLHRIRCTHTNTRLSAAHMHACRARARHRPPTTHCAKLWCASRPIFEGCSRPRSCAAPPAAAAAVRKNGLDRLGAPASATGAPNFLSRRQCPRRLGKNPGYTTSPRSALPADGEANTGGRTADPPARHRGPRAAACAARARATAPQKWLTRWHPASPGPLPGRRPPSPPRHHALPLRLPSDCSWAAAKFCFIFPG
jgi:hypothetical protein